MYDGKHARVCSVAGGGLYLVFCVGVDIVVAVFVILVVDYLLH